MKKFYLSLLFIFSAVLTYAAPDMYAHLVLYNQIDKTFFDKIANKEEATYMNCLTIEAKEKHLTEEIANQILLDSVDNWLEKTKYYITKTKRENEFKDILEIIDKKDIKQIPCNVVDGVIQGNDADIIIPYTDDPFRFCGDFTSCFLHTGAIIMYVPQKKKQKEYVRTMTHELGHAFGLADQYSGQICKGSFLYNSKVKRPSIMDKSKKVTCDDVDGFITSIDRTLNKEREFYSLCSDGVFIKNGQAVIKDYETYNFKENYEYFDAEVKVSYDTHWKDSYIVDMTLTNFILSDEGLNLIHDMGFDIPNLKTLKNVVVKIHGLTTDAVDLDKRFRDTVGLWTFVLYIEKGLQLHPKQVITVDYYGEDETPVLTYLDTNNSIWLSKDVIIPIINYFPYKGYGQKEQLRKEFPFRFLKRNKKEKSNQDTSAATKGGIDKNITKEINEHLKNIFPPDSK